jgi:hypothetical protein
VGAASGDSYGVGDQDRHTRLTLVVVPPGGEVTVAVQNQAVPTSRGYGDGVGDPGRHIRLTGEVGPPGQNTTGGLREHDGRPTASQNAAVIRSPRCTRLSIANGWSVRFAEHPGAARQRPGMMLADFDATGVDDRTGTKAAHSSMAFLMWSGNVSPASSV